MLVEDFRPSPVLDVLRYTDFDQFRHHTRIVNARSIPLHAKGFSAATATIRLPGCRIHLQRTFPRIVDASLEGGALVVVQMEQPPPVKFNGVDVEYAAMAFGRGATGYRATEWRAGTYAFIVFDQPMAGRGWPELENALRVFRLQPEGLSPLQDRIRAIFAFASRFPDDVAGPQVAENMAEQVLEALDTAFASCTPVGVAWTAYARQLKIVNAIDMLFESNPAAPLYSEALARECGASVRTLHNVAVRFRGVSLHQYLRMKRLWIVRQRLLTGDPALRVRACALENGFWHMGEFSAAYAALFGEVPSRTLARARSRAPSR